MSIFKSNSKSNNKWSKSNLYIFLVLFYILFIGGGVCNADETRKILFWAGPSWTGMGTNPYKTPNYLGQTYTKPSCPKQCEFSGDKAKQDEADAVVFEAQPLGQFGYAYLKDLPDFPQKQVDQYYVNFGFEHEHYFPLQFEPGYLSNIDVNMTFRQTSQVYITFTCSWGQMDHGSIDNFKNAPVKPFKEKIKGVGFMSSNCVGGGAIYRTQYIKNMMQLMVVDGLGECLHTKDLDKEDQKAVFADLGESMKIKEKVLGRYLFSLSFENNNITDYVTEKVYSLLMSGSIPIYMGADNIDEYVPEKSIIKTSDFKSPADLVKYLLYLSENEEEYNKYFEWKNKPYPAAFKEKYDRCVFYSGECNLCTHIHKIYDEVKSKENPGHRIHFGEPAEVKKNIRIAQFTHNSCIEVNRNASSHKPIAGQFTFMSWIYPESGSSSKILFSVDSISIGISRVWKQFYLYYCNGDNCVTGEKPIPFGEWRHIAVSITNETARTETIRLYVNGLEDVSLFSSSSVTSEVSNFKFGCKVWNTALSAETIRKSMFKKFRGDEVGLEAYMTFNDVVVSDYSKYRSALAISNIINSNSSKVKAFYEGVSWLLIYLWLYQQSIIQKQQQLEQ
ncbi:hypothetical protein PPL_05361 [Heterostelium album PN500]|uniref:Fucosyltransferase n=1 Tax=Heterostelium pallidum (strain ATCC 26659 / Pp 5 / PN500) TaxID=670386 RepID=D3B9Z0_HETP5|nr:hypothetical protein PPL_05361 [Heterostelium album PN500]EFA81377.1 hypothetical protein PPL_05361 [Heterostelium album PN500]|eukprot:XP_020433495.1 hypothetical protein PPL_05361 [Heterostelium album PN500]